MSESAGETIPKPTRWDRLPTGLKMWIILSVGLLPLGIVAIMASVENAKASEAQAQVEAGGLLAIHVQRFTLALARNSFTIRAARDALIDAPDPAAICARTLARLARAPNTPGRFALYGGGAMPRCVTPGFVPPDAPAPRPGDFVQTRIRPAGDLIEVFLYAPDGSVEGVAEYRREVLAEVIDTPRREGNFALELVQGDRTMPLRSRTSARGDEVSAEYPFANGGYTLHIQVAVPPIGLSALLVIVTPILMWLWASLVGWILVQRLLLQPLRRVQDVISAYQPGDRALDLPSISSPANEIAELGRAFAGVTETVARHEADLEAAVVRQTRLVREVHHRVKNNLQVVASLLNLHSRGATSEEAAAAYASIQRRVDALAVVHRNHYAELEENRGVALKPLISELSANLRGTAPAGAAAMQIRLDVASAHVTQDVAVAVAFLVTEIVELGMLCGATMVSVSLDRDEPASALLTIEIDSLAGGIECDRALTERFDRIITGLARQLRSRLDHDPDVGRYAVRIAIVRGED